MRDITGIAVGLGWCAAAVATSASVDAAAQAAQPRRLSISPQVRVQYDANILRLPDGVAPAGLAADGRREDYRVTPQARIDLSLPFGGHRLFAAGTAGYDFYRYNKRLERERLDLRGGMDLRLGRCRSTLATSFLRVQSDLGDARLLGTATRNAETRFTPGATIDCVGAGGIASGFSYEHQTVRNSSDQRAFGNYDSDEVGASLGISRPALGTVSLYSSARISEYKNRVVPLGTGERERIEVYQAGGRVVRQLGQFRGTLSGGYLRVRANSGPGSGFRGPSYGASVTWVPQPDFQFLLNADRTASQNNLLNTNYSITDRVDAGATYALSSRVRLRAGASQIWRDFQGAAPLLPVFGTVPQPDDRTLEVRGGVLLTATRGWGVDLDVVYRDRTADDPRFSFDTFIAAVTVRFR